MDVSFVEYTESFLDKTWFWLNDPLIKELTDTASFTRVEQREWYNSLDGRKDYLVWGVVSDDEPVGVVGLKHIDYTTSEAEYFGFIGEKQEWGKGIGKQMLEFAIEQALMLGTKSLVLNVIPSNERAIRLYKSFGFSSDNLHNESNAHDRLLRMKKVLKKENV